MGLTSVLLGSVQIEFRKLIKMLGKAILLTYLILFSSSWFFVTKCLTFHFFLFGCSVFFFTSAQPATTQNDTKERLKLFVFIIYTFPSVNNSYEIITKLQMISPHGIAKVHLFEGGFVLSAALRRLRVVFFRTFDACFHKRSSILRNRKIHYDGCAAHSTFNW